MNGFQNDISGHKTIHLVDATSFEMEETLYLPKTDRDNRWSRASTLFFDPCGRSMYASIEGILFEWDFQKSRGVEWCIGEE